MIKYYTRACNFYYGKKAQELINKKKALPLCGIKNYAFDRLEIIQRKNSKITSQIIHFKDINDLEIRKKRKIKKDLKKDYSKRKNFLKFVNFLEPSIMGIQFNA